MPPIRPELFDELLKDYQKPEDLLGDNCLLQQLTKALVERALQGELTHHLGYEKHSSEGDNSGNSRNGASPKTMRSLEKGSESRPVSASLNRALQGASTDGYAKELLLNPKWVWERLCEAASLRQAFSFFPSPDTRVL